MAYYRLENKDGSVPTDGMCAIHRGARIVEIVEDRNGPPLDKDGFAPDGWIWFPGPVR